MIALIIISAATGLSHQVYADSLTNSLKQRIGNYDVEMLTDPKSPVVGQNTRILLRFGSVNGDDLIDVPIIIKIFKDTLELKNTGQVLVSFGHYNYDYVFPKPGRYVLFVDVNDMAYSKQILHFIYFVDVSASLNYNSLPFSIITQAIVLVVIAIITVSVIFLKRKKKQENIGKTKH
jgi:hypothetical protein